VSNYSPTVIQSASNSPLPHSRLTTIDYSKSIALSAQRRDPAHMQGVFERHKGANAGLSKSALIAALQEVEAPVLSSSDFDSEDSLFRRADSNANGYVDQSECA
jgi:hypothetical protein